MADDEPRYLRRQKPLEIKRRKFGRKAWVTYLRAAGWTVVGMACAYSAYAAGHFLYSAREMALVHPEQVQVKGNQYVAAGSVREIFAADRGRSVLRVPLDARRRELESIAWVEHATVGRALPNLIQVEIVERTPVAFLRQGSDLALVDAHGVILDRPLKGRFRFPVVSGISAAMAADERESRMAMYSAFAQQIDAARPDALDKVSEVDLSDVNDVRATITGLPGSGASAANSANASGGSAWTATAATPVLIHFGESDFEGKYRTLTENIAQWRAAAGRVDSVDLRFSREAVVNPDTTVVAQTPAQKQETVAVATAPPLAHAGAAHSAALSKPAHKRRHKAAKRAA
jgi:cell division protein FtsQ